MIYLQFCNISSSTIRDSSRCCESLVDIDNVEWESHDKLGVSLYLGGMTSKVKNAGYLTE